MPLLSVVTTKKLLIATAGWEKLDILFIRRVTLGDPAGVHRATARYPERAPDPPSLRLRIYLSVLFFFFFMCKKKKKKKRKQISVLTPCLIKSSLSQPSV